MRAEVAEVALIIDTLARGGVSVRVSRGRLVVRGATLGFIDAIETLEGWEDAVEKALALGRRATRHGETRSSTGPDRGIPSATGGPEDADPWPEKLF